MQFYSFIQNQLNFNVSIPQEEIILEVKDGGWRGGDLCNFYFQHYEFIMGGGQG